MGRLFETVLLIGIILFANLTLAAEQTVTGNLLPIESTRVAYLYRDFFRVDPNIVTAFNQLGYEVEYIRESTLPKNLSIYKFVFIGDEIFLKSNLIDVSNLRTVTVNYHNIEDWGLSDRDGASQLGSTRPLSVMQGGTEIPVYTSALLHGRVAVQYYFVDSHNTVQGFTQVATTRTSSSGNNFGDVIFYGHPGMTLGNGKILHQDICYFGIVKSSFWTQGARNLFRDCVNFVAN